MHLIQTKKKKDNSIAKFALHLICQCAVFYDCFIGCCGLNSHINVLGHRVDDMNWIHAFNLGELKIDSQAEKDDVKEDIHSGSLFSHFSAFNPSDRNKFSIGISDKCKVPKQFEWWLRIAIIANVSFNFPFFPRNIFSSVYFQFDSFHKSLQLWEDSETWNMKSVHLKPFQHKDDDERIAQKM